MLDYQWLSDCGFARLIRWYIYIYTNILCKCLVIARACLWIYDSSPLHKQYFLWIIISTTGCQFEASRHNLKKKLHIEIWGFSGQWEGSRNPAMSCFFCSFRKRKIGGFDFRMTCLLHFFFEWEVTLGMILFVAFFAFCWMVSDWPAICDVHREILLNFFNRDRDGKSLWLLQIGFSLCFLQDSAPCCTLRIRGSNGSFFFHYSRGVVGGSSN